MPPHLGRTIGSFCKHVFSTKNMVRTRSREKDVDLRRGKTRACAPTSYFAYGCRIWCDSTQKGGGPAVRRRQLQGRHSKPHSVGLRVCLLPSFCPVGRVFRRSGVLGRLARSRTPFAVSAHAATAAAVSSAALAAAALPTTSLASATAVAASSAARAAERPAQPGLPSQPAAPHRAHASSAAHTARAPRTRVHAHAAVCAHGDPLQHAHAITNGTKTQ